MFHLTRKSNLESIKQSGLQVRNADPTHGKGIYVFDNIDRADVMMYHLYGGYGGEPSDFVIVEVDIDPKDLLMDEDALINLFNDQDFAAYVSPEAFKVYQLAVEKWGDDVNSIDDPEVALFKQWLIEKYNILADKRFTIPTRDFIFTGKVLSQPPIIAFHAMPVEDEDGFDEKLSEALRYHAL
jgi:hypothetical protein